MRPRAAPPSRASPFYAAGFDETGGPQDVEVEVDDDKRKGRKKKVTVMEYEFDADMEGGAAPPNPLACFEHGSYSLRDGHCSALAGPENGRNDLAPLMRSRQHHPAVRLEVAAGQWQYPGGGARSVV